MGRSLAHLGLLAGLAALASAESGALRFATVDRAKDKRTPEDISARQRKRAEKLSRRAAKAGAQKP